MSIASSLGLTADEAILLHDSNKLTLRLLPCDVLARVAPAAQQVAQFEIELARRLAESGSPVAAHPGNVLTTKNGLLFIDFETCCRGPVEFDLAHVPDEVSEHYPGVNQGLLRECRILVLAMITTWRWDRGDQFPNGRQLGTEWLSQIRAALDRDGLDTHG
jgi:hypothetical protein